MKIRNTGRVKIAAMMRSQNALQVAAPLAALLVALPVEARPVDLRCTIRDKKEAAYYGALAVKVDLDALSVQIEAPEKLRGYRWEYHNGQVAPPLVQAPPGTVIRKYLPATTPVLQFVNIAPQWITVGWRGSDGQLGQVSSFNRSALRKPGAACRWRTSFIFDLA
jgi:hypothetical protein